MTILIPINRQMTSTTVILYKRPVYNKLIIPEWFVVRNATREFTSKLSLTMVLTSVLLCFSLVKTSCLISSFVNQSTEKKTYIMHTRTHTYIYIYIYIYIHIYIYMHTLSSHRSILPLNRSLYFINNIYHLKLLLK